MMLREHVVETGHDDTGRDFFQILKAGRDFVLMDVSDDVHASSQEMKKNVNKLDAKDTAGTGIPKPEGAVKLQKENIPRKYVASNGLKAPSTRYGQQADLRDQNQLLLATNDKLQKNLIETQQRVAELELQFSDLKREHTDAQRCLRDCHVLLVAGKVDPVLGESIGEAARKHEEDRTKLVSVSRDLLTELRVFGEMASSQHAKLQEIHATITDLGEVRESLTQERKNFSLEVSEMEKALGEAEVLLME